MTVDTLVASIDPQEKSDIEGLARALGDGYKMLSAAAAHDRVVYVLVKSTGVPTVLPGAGMAPPDIK